MLANQTTNGRQDTGLPYNDHFFSRRESRVHLLEYVRGWFVGPAIVRSDRFSKSAANIPACHIEAKNECSVHLLKYICRSPVDDCRSDFARYRLRYLDGCFKVDIPFTDRYAVSALPVHNAFRIARLCGSLS